MNNADTLRQLKADNYLTSQAVADMLLVSVRTVNSWLVKPESTNYRPMDNRDIKFLKCLLKQKVKK